MAQKEVVDNVKLLDQIEAIMQPIRLEYVRLKRNLDSIQIKYDNILYEHEEDLDQTELTVENQVTFFLGFIGCCINNDLRPFSHQILTVNVFFHLTPSNLLLTTARCVQRNANQVLGRYLFEALI